MIRRLRITLAFALLVSATAWACDDGEPKVTIVGTLDGDRLLVREERFAGATLKLFLFDLAKNKVTLFADIVTEGDLETEREKVRGARWKKAEAELQKQGLVLKTLEPRKLPLTVGGAKLEVVENKSTCRSTLRAVAGRTKTKLRETGTCSLSDSTDFSGVIVTEGERYVIPMLWSLCLGDTADWLHAIPVAKFAPAKPTP